jgi:hypothetical protein
MEDISRKIKKVKQSKTKVKYNQAKVKQSQTKIKKSQAKIKQIQTADEKREAKLKLDKAKIEVDVENGILGVKRDTLMSLVDLMIFRENSLIRNVFFFYLIRFSS